jgi:hypothetical protein
MRGNSAVESFFLLIQAGEMTTINVAVIVARAEKMIHDFIGKGLKSLHFINANILGLVINGLT